MSQLGRQSRWCADLFGVTSALLCLSGCHNEDSDATRRGLSEKALHASRVTSHVVGEPQAPDESDAGMGRASRPIGGAAGMVPAIPLKDRERLAGDALATRNTDGVILEAEWRWSDVPAPSNAPETSSEGLESLRNATKLRMRIVTAAAGRLGIAFIGYGYPWPDGTELRARADRLGHLLVWPDGKHYRHVVAGALRALFADRRLDRGPLFLPRITTLAAGYALAQPTTRQGLNTPVGEIQLDQANVPSAGVGAALLCRFLVELVGVAPDTAVCTPDQLVLKASITSAPGGKLQFIVNQISRKQDIPLAGIQVPPDGATFESDGVPFAPISVVPRTQLAALRSRPAAAVAPTKDAPQQGLVAVNRTLTLRALLLDGVPVAWLPPDSELFLPELKHGNYSVSWRDFFGTSIEPTKNISLPAKVTVGKLAESGG